MKRLALIPLLALGIASPGSAEVLGIGKNKAEATMINAQGLPVGKAKIVESKKKGLSVSVSVKGMPKGEKGIHLHLVGQCEGPKFVSAGGHWNPHGKMHGRDNPEGAHAGDLPNIIISKKGRGTLKFEIVDMRLHTFLDDDGGAIVLHAQSDDNRTDPSGNSGDRIACGVFVEK